MKDQLVRMTYDIDLEPGEPLRLPDALVATIGPGRWRLTVQPLPPAPARSHTAFLSSYAPEDEGLYDDCPGR
jgi:hypothetical protein